MITLYCDCGERYFADEKYVGSSILCRKCRNLVPIRRASSVLMTDDNEVKDPISQHRTENDSDSSRIFSGSLVFKERFLNRHVTVRRLLVVLAIFFGIFIVILALLIPKFRGTKPAQQPEAFTPSSSIDANPKSGSHTKAKDPAPVNLPKASQPQEDGSQTGTRPPRGLDGRADAVPKEIDPSHYSGSPQVAKDIQPKPNEIEPPYPNRLHTGATPLGDGVRDGRCIVKVINGTDTDALVRVIRIDDGEQLFRNFYLIAGTTFTAEKFASGNYVLKVAFGSDWNEGAKRFNFRRSFEKTELFTLNETKEPTTGGYVTKFTNMTLTLHKVIDGNFHSSPISEAEFWR
jgi:hypothetical protein